jgi:uncharacterized protein YcfL
MKKLSIVIVVVTMLLGLVGCSTDENNINSNGVNEQENSSQNATNEDATNEDATNEDATNEEVANEELTLEEIIDQIYEKSGMEFPMMGKSELTSENMAYMLGVDNFEYLEGVASEPMMSSQAHSIVLFTVEDGADIDQIKTDIKENVDGRKWICVGVEPNNILVDNVGNHIILIMDDASEILMDAFLSTVK